MSEKTQKLAIRLLREGLNPQDACRVGVDLADWPKIAGAQIALGTFGSSVPRWVGFLDLSSEEKRDLYNKAAYGLVFVRAADRWFAISFGMGHVKLDPTAFEQDFGLRVVLNAVDPKQLKSADLRTPDENTLSRRSQTSRGSDHTAFAIDIERDIVRGLAGTPKDSNFASRVAGTDTLSMDRKLKAADLPAACAEAYALYQSIDYKAEFGWIDQIRHIRDKVLIDELENKVIEALDGAVRVGSTDSLHLAFPIIYDPERTRLLRYKGFRSGQLYADLDITGYLDALKERQKASYAAECLRKHSVHEVDDEGRDCGGQWNIHECLVFETQLNGETYVLSGGRWYHIDHDLAEEVQDFFNKTPHRAMPKALANELEGEYNARIAADTADMICLDRKLIKPTGAKTRIEACDLLSRQGHIIHVKDKTSSSRLSHLFSQGTVSARVLAIDALARDSVRTEIEAVQKKTGQTGYESMFSKEKDLRRADFTIVYAVIASGDQPSLPFFSLISFRQAARELAALGYKCSFAWIEKPKTAANGAAKRVPKAQVAQPRAVPAESASP